MSVARMAAPSSCMQAAQAAERCWGQPEGHNPSTSTCLGIDDEPQRQHHAGKPPGHEHLHQWAGVKQPARRIMWEIPPAQGLNTRCRTPVYIPGPNQVQPRPPLSEL